MIHFWKDFWLLKSCIRSFKWLKMGLFLDIRVHSFIIGKMRLAKYNRVALFYYKGYALKNRISGWAFAKSLEDGNHFDTKGQHWTRPWDWHKKQIYKTWTKYVKHLLSCIQKQNAHPQIPQPEQKCFHPKEWGFANGHPKIRKGALVFYFGNCKINKTDKLQILVNNIT